MASIHDGGTVATSGFVGAGDALRHVRRLESRAAMPNRVAYSRSQIHDGA